MAYRPVVGVTETVRTPACLESLEPGITLKVGAPAGPLDFDGNLISLGFDGEQGRYGACPPVPTLGTRCLPLAPGLGRIGSAAASD